MRIRGLLTLGVGAAAVPGGLRLGLGPARDLLDHPGTLAARAPDDLLAGVLGLVLVTTSVLWGMSLLLALAEAAAPARLAAWVRRVPRPGLARALVLGVLGTAVVTLPAHAGTAVPEPVDEPLAGLPLPDRVATTSAVQPVAPAARLVARAPTRSVEVRPGDTLWSIADHALGPGASDAAVDAAWRAIAAVNSRAVDDPDLIFPGTELALPPLPHRKERP